MNFINLSPPASSLVESIRNIGYSFDSAVADIVDNSISYKSKNIDIDIHLTSGDVSVSICDDGAGMSPEKLKQAMSLGGKSPTDTRSNDDLGRFGLGLKLASFSQSKKLTVISKTLEAKSWYGIQWDLDHVIKTNSWEAIELNDERISQIIDKSKFKVSNQGTCVLWESSDRITQDIIDIDDLSVHVERLISNLKERLSLIFHKYLDKNLITLKVNQAKINGMDPFCLKGGADVPHATLEFEELFTINDAKIVIRGYLLPHINRMGGLTREKQISLDADHTASQGLYLYRLDRLISYGGWHGIIRKSEANKLARVEISFGNDADSMWQLDVKKSSAILPASIRPRLRDLIRGLSGSSHDVFSGRKKLKKTNPNSVWQRIFNKDTKTISYEIDRRHPIIVRFIDEIGNQSEILEDFLYFLESTFPADLIANDLIADGTKFVATGDDLDKKIAELADVVSATDLTFSVFRDTVFGCGLFSQDEKNLDKLVNKNKGKFKL